MAKESDWEYRCTSCGHLVTARGDFNQPCPKCRGHGWTCHWLNLPEKRKIGKGWGQSTTPSVFNKLSQETEGVDDIQKGWDKNSISMLGGVETRNSILSHEKTAMDGTEPENNGILEDSPARKRGRPKHDVPDDLILELASQGVSSRAMVEELAKRGAPGISYKTIQRRLQASLL